MKKRFTSEEQIIKAIERCHERSAEWYKLAEDWDKQAHRSNHPHQRTGMKVLRFSEGSSSREVPVDDIVSIQLDYEVCGPSEKFACLVVNTTTNEFNVVGETIEVIDK